jgi:hypothetical protein
LVLILLHDEGHDHVLDELSLRLSKLRLTVYCAATHLDRSCDHLCDNELRPLCAAQRSAELLGDHHPGTNGRNLVDHDLLEDGHYLDDRDLLVDDLLNHHGYKTNDRRDHRDLRDLLTDDRDLLVDDPLNHHDHTTDDHRDLRDLLTDDHYLDDRDLPVDDPLNHHGYTTDDHRDLLTDDRDLGHHFARMQDDLLDDYRDGLDVRHDLMMDGRDYLMDDPGPRLVCLNDHRHRRDALDALVCQILLPVADDVDRDFQGLALDEVYLHSTAKHRTYARWY